MREVHQILRLFDLAAEAGEDAVLATVVKTRGSSYRLPGARLLVTRGGEHAGSISGGCLEGDLLKKCWWLTETGPAIRRYDTNADGEIESGYGLGCNGIIHVLLERLAPALPGALSTLRQVRDQRVAAVICRVLAPRESVGRQLTLGADGRVQHNLENSELLSDLQTSATAALGKRASSLWQSGDWEVFIETLVPPPRLLVFGAGDDVIPITELAALQGWQAHIFDGRSQFARRERFPLADAVYVRPLGLPFDSSEAPVGIDEWTVAVLMTHSYSQDLDILRQLAHNPPRYVGLLGPQKRSLRLLSDAQISEEHFGSSLFGPMGLDIGADGPEQVALAVVSEIQGFLNDRGGGSLRDRRGSIHSREPSDDADAIFQVGSIACA